MWVVVGVQASYHSTFLLVQGTKMSSHRHDMSGWERFTKHPHFNRFRSEYRSARIISELESEVFWYLYFDQFIGHPKADRDLFFPFPSQPITLKHHGKTILADHVENAIEVLISRGYLTAKFKKCRWLYVEINTLEEDVWEYYEKKWEDQQEFCDLV